MTARIQAVALVLTLAVATNGDWATAEGVDNTTPAEAVAAIADAAPAVLHGAADVAVDTNNREVISATVGTSEITVPKDPAVGIVIDPASGPAVRIGLPTAKSADDAKPLADGAVVYDNNNGSATVPVVKDDGSVAINTTITGPEAPRRYRYPITVPEGGSLELNADGTVSVLDANGAFTSGFAAAWAKDALSRNVATHYEVIGNALVQVVEHTAPGVVYPVVADPWYGPSLISHVRWIDSGRTLAVYPTWWGRYGAGSGFRWAAWDEVVRKAPSANRGNMADQFYCHWDFVRIRSPRKESWNLDKWRPNVSYAQTVRQNCNPT